MDKKLLLLYFVTFAISSTVGVSLDLKTLYERTDAGKEQERATGCHTGSGGPSCCKTSNLCGEGEGDCDSDTHCKAGLLCGKDNCNADLGFPSAYDCCYDPNQKKAGSDWSYAGQGNYWPVSHPGCAGKRQSPIDIDTTKVYDADEPSLEFTDYNQNTLAGKFKNEGSSLKFSPKEGAAVPGVSIPGGSYNLLQFHFHWGSTNDRGSEHTVDGQSFAMELHLVHINNDKVDTALSEPDGLAVVGIMFVVGGDGSDFAPLQPIIDAANALHADPNAEVDTDVTLKDFLEVVGPGYYSYDGSLTTPGCNEVVTWFVMEKAIAISQEQIDVFRRLSYTDSSPMVDNFRPPQPLNNRIVKRGCFH